MIGRGLSTFALGCCGGDVCYYFIIWCVISVKIKVTLFPNNEGVNHLTEGVHYYHEGVLEICESAFECHECVLDTNECVT